jgi:exodeoxyribonuclease VII large subunit
MVVARKHEFCLRIDRVTHRLSMAMRARRHQLESRLRALEARPGLAGLHGRIVMRGRDAAELAHELRRALRARLAAQARTYQLLRRSLETFDIRVRLGGIGRRLAAADGRLAGAIVQRAQRANARLGGTAARLEALSPLAVLGRGYAVCWNADRTAVIRDAGTVTPGDHVRVTLARGELECDVKSSS